MLAVVQSVLQTSRVVVQEQLQDSWHAQLLMDETALHGIIYFNSFTLDDTGSLYIYIRKKRPPYRQIQQVESVMPPLKMYKRHSVVK